MACPTCDGTGVETLPERPGDTWVRKQPCSAPDCPHVNLQSRVAKDVKVVNLAPNQDWSGLPVVFNEDTDNLRHDHT